MQRSRGHQKLEDLAAVQSGLASVSCLLGFVLSYVSLLPSQDLYEAGELKWGTDEAQFIYILGNRSKQHLRLGEFPNCDTSSGDAENPFLYSFLLMVLKPLHLQTKY